MKKFIITFIISFIIFYAIEHLIEFSLMHFYGIDLHNLNIGWMGTVGLVIFLGFKYHILCCLVPLIWTTYKCNHDKKCKHEHCKRD